jgi:transcriptional regulator with XRE-family HTH domain
MVLNKNEFGGLVKAYRNQRGWTQEELAERWGYAREYVSQIERGKRRLDSVEQVVRLADILDIPQEKLEAIGRGIPRRKIQATTPKEADDAILQMLLAPSRDMVQLSYMLWIADQHPVLEEKLEALTLNLDQALTSYHGEFLKPAQQLLAYTHQMRGRIAFDHLDFASASGHYAEMVDLGRELNDPDIVTTGMVYQGSLLRKRGRFEAALRCFEAAQPFMAAASTATQGIYHLNLSTVYADAGQEKPFLQAIDSALEIARDVKDSIVGLANDFSLDDVLWAQAGGFSELWKPEEALEVYKKTDKLRPFRPLRELGAYTIDKGEAYLRSGDLDQGLVLSLKGIQLASEYRSKRQIGWVEKTYNRLRVLPVGQDKRLNTLRDALIETKRKQEGW